MLSILASLSKRTSAEEQWKYQYRNSFFTIKEPKWQHRGWFFSYENGNRTISTINMGTKYCITAATKEKQQFYSTLSCWPNNKDTISGPTGLGSKSKMNSVPAARLTLSWPSPVLNAQTLVLIFSSHSLIDRTIPFKVFKEILTQGPFMRQGNKIGCNCRSHLPISVFIVF